MKLNLHGRPVFDLQVSFDPKEGFRSGCWEDTGDFLTSDDLLQLGELYPDFLGRLSAEYAHGYAEYRVELAKDYDDDQRGRTPKGITR